MSLDNICNLYFEQKDMGDAWLGIVTLNVFKLMKIKTSIESSWIWNDDLCLIGGHSYTLFYVCTFITEWQDVAIFLIFWAFI